MRPAVSARKVETVPTEGRVFHYDELDEDVQQLVFSLVEGDRDRLEPAGNPTVSDGDCVKFTDYYRIDCRQPR